MGTASQRLIQSLSFLIIANLTAAAANGSPSASKFPLFSALTDEPAPTLIAYSPLELDPRSPSSHRRLTTTSIKADLEALRPAFNGLIIYGCHEASTPKILEAARDLKFRIVLLGVWNPKSTVELDVVTALVQRYQKDFALGVIVGNEGITFHRYKFEDLEAAAARLRGGIPDTVPLATSEPLVGYSNEKMRGFGDFHAANIHPVFDRRQLGPADAARWVRETAVKLASETNKPVIVKETGFPHGGSEAYTPATQALFWREYVKPGLIVRSQKSPAAWAYCGAGFEAFDLDWKAQLSRLPIEKHWGLLSSTREPYPALAVWADVRADADKAGGRPR